MKKNTLLTVAIAAFIGFSHSGYAKTTASPAVSQTASQPHAAQAFTILDRYHLHEAKADFDEPLWQSYLYPEAYMQNAMKNLMALLYQNTLAQINESPDLNEQEKQQYREQLTQQMGSESVQPAQKQPDVHPLLLQAHQYARGQGVKRNDAKANKLLLEVANDKLDTQAYELVAIRAMHGIGQGNEHTDAMSVFQSLAEVYEEEQMSPIWAYLSYGYTYGIGVEKDPQKAKHYWDLAKHYYSLTFDRTGVVGYMMGQMIEENKFLKGTPAEAMNYYNIATRATENNIAAQQAILKLLQTEQKFEDLSYEIELFMAEHGDLTDPDTLFTLSELYAQKQWTIYNPKKSLDYL